MRCGFLGAVMPFNLQKERLRGIFEQTSDGILVLDRYLRVIGLNPAAEVMIGWNASQVAEKMMLGEVASCTDRNGIRLEEFSLPPSELVPEGKVWSRELEITILRSDGRNVWLPGVFIFSPSSAEGDPYGYILMRDIGERVLEGELIERERIDSVSGLYTRAFFDDLYEKEVRRAIRHGGLLAVLIVELQNLDKITGKEQNSIDESVIKQLGRQIKATTRAVDTAARYKSNEFVVLLLDSDLSRTTLIGQRVRDRIKALSAEAGFTPSLKFRIGVAVADHDYGSLLMRGREALK
jgi:diguanylate cyclase (GGDEF)-like protein/PAS domain S-box-containing protein